MIDIIGNKELFVIKLITFRGGLSFRKIKDNFDNFSNLKRGYCYLP